MLLLIDSSSGTLHGMFVSTNAVRMVRDRDGLDGVLRCAEKIYSRYYVLELGSCRNWYWSLTLRAQEAA